MTPATEYTVNLARIGDLLEIGISRANVLHRSVLVSHTERGPAIDGLRAFVTGWDTKQECFLWEQPAQRFRIVGAGTAAKVDTVGVGRFADAARRWRNLLEHGVIDGVDTLPGTGPTLVGGFAFDPAAAHTCTWKDFPDGSLTLPALQITTFGTTTTLTVNMVVNEQASRHAMLDEIERLCDTVLHPETPVAVGTSRTGLHVEDALPPQEWKTIVATTTQQIRQGQMEKVALAREVRVVGMRQVSLEKILHSLRNHYPTASTFAVSRGESVFLGATPERLVGLRSGVVGASGLAGTAPRGATPVEDARIGQELLDSSKNRHEHAVVVDMLREALGGLCVDVNAPPMPTLLKLPNVQHLYTPVSGRLRPRYSLLDLVARLHPTPAVGGLPREAALEHIRAHERLDRGWYAGPIGWIDARGEGDFAVALRSGLIVDGTAHLFAGCGIVAQSDPEAEFLETWLKLRPMMQAVGATE